MFLYAKLVLQNLHAQPTRGDLIEGITRDNFPEGLRGAYVRNRPPDHPGYESLKMCLADSMQVRTDTATHEARLLARRMGESQEASWLDDLRKTSTDLEGNTSGTIY